MTSTSSGGRRPARPRAAQPGASRSPTDSEAEEALSHFTFYEILGVAPRDCGDRESLTKRYRQEARMWHPDKAAAGEDVVVHNARFKKLKQA